MNIFDKITFLQENSHSYPAKRATSQLRYGFRISQVNDGKFHSVIENATENLMKDYENNGAITNEGAKACEEELMVLSGEAKKFTLGCVTHAHIDMNWMWGYNETVAITLDTFRTLLRLLNEYPQLTYSQSQASTYEIVERHDPEMFEQIKEMVAQGRWEVTASTWVETDKNMTSGESLARHILYTKNYFKEKFNLSGESLLLDFEPDTFGHNASVPEILGKGGVKYYFHCRGYKGHNIYNWKSPSGATILVHREPDWYNSNVTYDYADFLPDFCKNHGTDRMLRVCGVGDHGGGPTRRDIERLLDMQSWPCYANIEFTTYHDYFNYLETIKDRFPTVEGELNYIFTGCYSSQSRIKMANRTAEDSLNTAECLTAFDLAFAKGNEYNRGYKTAWQKTLFSHFHDILPGSGIRETREYALAELTNILGYTYAGRTKALTNLASKIDTSSIQTDFDKESFVDGAGMGYKGVAQFNGSLVRGLETQICDTGCGKTRIMHIFNTTPYDRSESFDFPIWDWPGKIDRLEITDGDEKPIPFFIAEGGGNYWTHTCINLTAFVTVPGYGYITLVISEGDSKKLPLKKFTQQPIEEEYQKTFMENEKISVEFDSNMQIISLVDKTTGRELISSKSGYFSLCNQNHKTSTVMPGNAWVEGYALKEKNLNETSPVFITEFNRNSHVKDEIKYEFKFRSSKIGVSVSLDKDSSVLKYKVDADWHETFSQEEGIPALKFNFPFSYKTDEYTYEIPFGTVKRKDKDHDVPSIGFGVSHDMESDKSLMLMTDSIYAYRGENNAFSLTLIRASQDPDSHPEYGMHNYNIGLGVCGKSEYFKYSDSFNYPMHYITNSSHGGSLPLTKSFISTSDNIAVSAIKVSEDGKGIIARVYDITGKSGKGSITLGGEFTIQAVDIMENPLDTAITREGKKVVFDLKPNEIVSLKFKK